MVKKIKWDPGHGGKDPGIVDNGMQEKDLALKIVNYAMNYMQNNYTGFSQTTTRTGDTYPSLQGRCDQANNEGSDVFVSVHINGGGGTGYESYVCNRNDSTTNALQDSLNREILAANVPYGKKAHGGVPIKTNSTLHVLNGTNMPAVLTENLYLDSADANTLRDEGYLKVIGQAHARGVAAHLGLARKTPVEPVEPPVQYEYIMTGGYTNGASIEKVLNFLRETGYGKWIEITKDCNLIFYIGDFGPGSEAKEKVKKFLDDNGFYKEVRKR